MAYVRRADGSEFLFLRDVAWTMRNVVTAREKARMVTWLVREDRGRVREELASLYQHHAAVPQLHLRPGHDAVMIDTYVKMGLLVKGF